MQPDKKFVATEIDPDVARRFKQICRSEDRTVAAGIRRLIGQYVESVENPQNGQRPDVTPVAGETSTDAIGRDRVPTA